MVILAVELRQLCAEVLAHTNAGISNDLDGPLAQHVSTVFRNKDQMHM